MVKRFQHNKEKTMKIVTTLIALLAILMGVNIYSSFTERDRLETALLLLDERINLNATTIEEVEEYIVDSNIDNERLYHIVLDNIKGVATAIDNHEHEPVYIEKPEVPAVKITTEPEPVVEEQPVLKRYYDIETQLHVPSLPVVEPTPVASCPRATNNLGKFIENVSLRKSYKFIINYDILDGQVTNIDFNINLPSRLKSAMIKYVNTFSSIGDVTDCKVSIKLLEN